MKLRRGLLLSACGAALVAGCAREPDALSRLFLTREQAAQRAFERGDFAAAAELFVDPWRRGTALHAAGEFEAAASAFARLDTAEGHYDRAHALILLGRYEQAVQALDRALELRPGWEDAETNRAIARARAQRLERPQDAPGTGGQLAADELVFDGAGPNASDSQEEAGAGTALSDAEIQALWLRRVEPRPADFLRVRFAWQLAQREERE